MRSASSRSTQHAARSRQSPITNHQSPALPALPALVCGIGLALLILAKSSNAVIAPLFLVYLLVTGDGAWGERVRRALWAMSPVGAAVAITVAYNYARFGTLLGFPLEPFERFSTPLIVGLAGLLVSPGKGLLWFVPLAWPAMAGAVAALRGRARLRPAAALLALGCVVGPLLLYALWYDWPGGRAWGPRMVAWTMPALVLLALPLLDALPDRSRPRPLRIGVGILLGLSVLAQLPGVLWNFETVEARAMNAGASFEALIRQLAHSPLLTTWGAARTLAPEPLLLQPALWGEPLRALLPLALIVGAAACLLWAARRPARIPLVCAALLALTAGGSLAAAARLDPRRLDPTANPADNAALVAYMDEHAAPADLLLFDLRDDRDPQARAWWRLDALPAPPSFAGLLRAPAVDGDLLQQLTAGRARVWLVMVETAEGDPAATIEAWLDAHGWRGASTWLGAQRVVEYSMAAGGAAVAASESAIDFGPLALDGYRVEQGPRPGDWRVALRWSRPAPELRFSLQALDAAGALAAQIDRAPAADVDRILLAAPAGARLILKLYDPATGAPLGAEQQLVSGEW